MARFLKNPSLAQNSLAAALPMVPDSTYGDAPVSGLIRFNEASQKIEFYYSGAWKQVAHIGTVQLVVDTFQGDGLTQVFTMSQAETDPNAVAVFIDGVYQQPIINYAVSGTAITFTSAPPAPVFGLDQVVVIHNINSTNAV